MTIANLKKLIQEIVTEAQRLNVAHTSDKKAPVNYACIFAQNETEYEELINLAHQLGPTVQETAMGPVFHITPLSTAAGTLELVKIRRPDPKRPEKGDADFTVANYESFKKTYLGQPGFGVIKRSEMEMIELIDPSYKALAYFSYPTLATVLKIDLGEKTHRN